MRNGLRLLVNDMLETMLRRSRSLVDQQLSLTDQLERNEQDPIGSKTFSGWITWPVRPPL
ncbi:hypothetical protein [Mycobacterium lepromatosis]|uniref:hypothetical protein n=1 Tax=Mycobacterium lepromatosis TaxID=480418 RepID=UPI000B126D5D|nr:hypothetical protein [Mycobacterium lepromatosis]